MRTLYLHASAAYVAVTIKGSSQYYVRASWANDLKLLDEPPGLPRTSDNYFQNAAQYVANPPTAANPLVLRADATWWRRARERERTVYALVEWRKSPNQPWVMLDTLEYVVNHSPRANAGPDQVAIVDAAGNLTAEVSLDGSASDDPDQNAALHPAGTLTYSWAAIQTPAALTPHGPAWTAAHGLRPTATPLFLAAGTAIPPSDRGVYAFRLTVDDNEAATLGTRAGQSLTNTSDMRVMLGAQAGPGLTVLSPTSTAPYFGNFEDGVDVPVHFTVDPALVQQNAYHNGWLVRCTITLALDSPVYPSGRSQGETVFEATTAARTGPVETIHWNGRTNRGTTTGWRAVGAFTVKLELLDSTGALPAGIAGNVTTQNRAIVLDGFRWKLPVDAPWAQTILSGGFGESGHAGGLQTRLHTGIDISAVGPPDIVAARSGFYPPGNPNADGVHRIELTHALPDRTHYLHADQLANYAPGELVLQGAKLGRMSNVSPGSLDVHLHFEHRVQTPTDPGPTVRNPLGIVPLRDVYAPEIEGVFVRQAPAAGAADMSAAHDNITGMADLVVRSRDYAHPDRLNVGPGTLLNGLHRLEVLEQNAVAAWRGIRLDAIPSPGDAQHVAVTHLRDVFALQANNLQPPPVFPRTRDNHYLNYLRWNTAGYQQQGGPLRLEISVVDFSNARRRRTVVIGPDATLRTPPPTPATTNAAPAPFSFDIEVVNRTNNLNGAHTINASVASPDGYQVHTCTDWISNDNCHVTLAGAPPGWTISPARTGALSNGATPASPQGGAAQPQVVTVTIDPHGQAPAGTHTFDIVVSSHVLRQAGSRIPVTVRVN
ncbi:M23 family metallopeptidase [Streptomyces sp. NBC_00568]|uniref:M23 family metallopeptidase n=1 Tax=Streptomyces sp. NBC_00568 TaxID=2975779 RepID=UPI00224CAA42|nr:hypothetical protein [Streptomyces sp. NBC_00568]MCX4993574.1 hypothetical protein [Streptomyces sp. NBC_00568]